MLVFVGALCCLANGLDAQMAFSSPPTPDAVRTLRGQKASEAAALERSPFDRMVVLDLKNAPFSAALEQIAKQADIRFVYSDALVPRKRLLTVHNTRLSVREALRYLLKGTGLVPEASGNGKIVLRKSVPGDSVESRPQSGSISGRVIDSATRAPLMSVVVSVRGMRLAAQTQSDGSYRLPAVPVGPHVIEVRLLGYASRQVSITVTGEAQQVNFVLVPTATQLTSVVTTAAGEQTRLTVGNSIATVDAEEVVKDMPIRSMADLLEARVPGLVVTRASGAVGAGARLRIRGVRSASMSNDPIVILDGIRITSETLDNDRNPNMPGKNSRPSRLDDIDPNTIESIDVLKGPSASALYGSDAANGVIVIKTKRPKAGAARWQLLADRSDSKYAANYSDAMRTFGTYLSGYASTCTLEVIAIGSCAKIDSVVTYDIMRNPYTTPFATGHDQQASANVSGGSQAMRYFVSGTYTDQLGPSKVPYVNVRAYERAHGPGSAAKSLVRPNKQTSVNFTGNITAQLTEAASLSIRSTLLSRFQQRGNDGLQNAYSTYGVRSISDTLSSVPTAQNVANKRTDQVRRTTTGISGNWQARSWLSMQGTFGYDFAFNKDRDLLPRNACQPFCMNRDSLGLMYFGRRDTEVRSGTFGTTGTWSFPMAFNLQVAFGGQYALNRYSDLNGYAEDLSAGRATPTSAGGTKRVDEAYDEYSTAGWYFQPRVSWGNRLYLTAAMRQDAGSALGGDVKPLYPKWDASYLISEESFFEPIRPIVNTLRLRAAFGHAGIQPGSSFKLRTFSQLVRLVTSTGALENYAMLSGVGNEQLRPERSTELEYGADIEFLDSRVRFEFTWFRERTRDAIMNRPLAPSIGTSSTRRENVGTIRNTGSELSVSATVIQLRGMTYDINVGYSSHVNFVESLGPNVSPFSLYSTIQGTDDGRIVGGYPLFSRWAIPVAGFYDANGDGIIAKSEIRYGDTLVYMGPSEPKYDLSMTHSFAVLGGRVRFSATTNYTHNFMQFNEYRANSEFFRPTWNIKATDGAGLQRQAYAAAQNGRTRYGYLENTNTFRLNSLSAQAIIPQRVTRHIRASQATVALIGSNIGLWSSYTGPDPSVNTTSTTGNRVQDNGGLPIPRSWGFRVVLSY